MKLVHRNRNGADKDITQLTQRYTWGGDYREVSRKLELSVTVSPHDVNLPEVPIETGEMILFFDDSGNELFQGYIFRKSKSYNGNELQLTVYDKLVYLVKSKLSKVFHKVTPEAATSIVCNELGIAAGELAPTNIPITFVHLGKTGYEAIVSAYFEASKQNGKMYMPRMNGEKLDVIEKGIITAKRLVLSNEHITDSTYSEDAEGMINQVIITDDKGNKIATVNNEGWSQMYGLLQDVYQKEEGKDPRTIATNMLKDLTQEASITMSGGSDTYDAIAGNAIQIKEGYTGLTGLFFIDSDTHTFENGQHNINLILNFRNVMDEQEIEKAETKKKEDTNFTLNLDY